MPTKDLYAFFQNFCKLQIGLFDLHVYHRNNEHIINKFRDMYYIKALLSYVAFDFSLVEIQPIET